ncbi:hypothetical protein AL036_00795 [Salipiger aestuarii]|uniref:DUF3859 domain-containing protein n=1 Tax=Salipiger aestuarii TaxID=568098 RepID=UPI00025B8B01|nr:DUF3859 domain-containing protein [Salipiger aestuarii]EIE48782.1 hypothetical protein C357_21520 [Citreicella sp. 357]KAA8610451.1 hypothetical protein AL036_00795 [Salipiger aestuarii]KAA8616467.1 hypothetical protein AL037_00790 [Salipiger aestuarii]
MFARAALLVLASTPAVAAPAESFANDPVVLIDYGVICQVASSGSRPAPETLLGEISLIDQTRDMDVTTRVVPAKAGISFGVKFTVVPGTGDLPVTVIVTHPPMGDAAMTRETWGALIQENGSSLNLFTFDFPFEMRPGAWSMAIEADGRRLMEQHFDVVSELAAPAVLSVCYGQDFVS